MRGRRLLSKRCLGIAPQCWCLTPLLRLPCCLPRRAADPAGAQHPSWRHVAVLSIHPPTCGCVRPAFFQCVDKGRGLGLAAALAQLHRPGRQLPGVQPSRVMCAEEAHKQAGPAAALSCICACACWLVSCCGRHHNSRPPGEPARHQTRDRVCHGRLLSICTLKISKYRPQSASIRNTRQALTGAWKHGAVRHSASTDSPADFAPDQAANAQLPSTPC